MICYCPGRTDGFYQVPDSVRTIRASAFSYTGSLAEVKLPDSLITIRDWAFGHTGLTEVLLPKNLRQIDFCAFGACSNLMIATVPASLTVIGDRPAVPHTCTVDGSTAYWECGLCGNRFLDNQAIRRAGDTVVPAAHSYESAVTTEPTCSETGARTGSAVSRNNRSRIIGDQYSRGTVVSHIWAACGAGIPQSCYSSEFSGMDSLSLACGQPAPSNSLSQPTGDSSLKEGAGTGAYKAYLHPKGGCFSNAILHIGLRRSNL